MTVVRKVLIAEVLGGVVLIHLFCIVVGKEAWPFSHYPMYSWMRPQTWEIIELHGIPEDPAKEEFQFPSNAMPYCLRRLQGVERLVRLQDEDPNARQLLGATIGQFKKSYETNRLEKQHDLEPISGVALYIRHFEKRETRYGFEMKEVGLERVIASQ